MHLTFPPSTEPLGFRKQAWQDTFIMLKVSMKRSELPAFIESSRLAGKQARRDRVLIYGNDEPPWWMTYRELEKHEGKADQQAFCSYETDLPGVDHLRVLIDLRDLKTAIVYIEFTDG
jgi:hypothetical protein